MNAIVDPPAQNPAPLNGRPTVAAPRPIVIDFEQVKNAVGMAKEAGAEYTCLALLAGHTLLEYRASGCWKRQSHRGTVKVNRDDDAAFYESIEVLGLRRTTAYRWMDAARRVACAVWPKHSDGEIDFSVVVNGQHILISRLLTVPANDSEREERSRYLELIAGKTLKECLSGIIIDGNEPHAFTRAHNGLNADGAGYGGENRKDFARFMGRHAGQLFSHASHWQKMTQEARATALRAIAEKASKEIVPIEFLDCLCGQLSAVRKERRQREKAEAS